MSDLKTSTAQAAYERALSRLRNQIAAKLRAPLASASFSSPRAHIFERTWWREKWRKIANDGKRVFRQRRKT